MILIQIIIIKIPFIKTILCYKINLKKDSFEENKTKNCK